MKKKYLAPELCVVKSEPTLLNSNSEDEVTYNIGAKENNFVFDDDLSDNLWGDEPDDEFTFDE